MNWVGLWLSLSIIAVAILTAPWGLLLLVGLYWIYRRS